MFCFAASKTHISQLKIRPTESKSVVKGTLSKWKSETRRCIHSKAWKMNMRNKYDTTSRMHLTDISRTSPLKY